MKKNNSQSTKASCDGQKEQAKDIGHTSLTSAERVLAVLFGFGFILGFLLTPLGVEPRMPELRTLTFAGFFITVGLLIPLAGLVSLWLKKPRIAGILAVIDQRSFSSPHQLIKHCSSSLFPLHLQLRR